MRTKNELYQEALRTVARRRQTARARAEDARAEAEAALRRAGTAPRPPPPLRTPAGSSRSCWRPAAARLTRWNLASPASSARIPAW